MSYKDFDEHKNIEQLRYYLECQFEKISNQLGNDDGALESYFFASIIDYLICKNFDLVCKDFASKCVVEKIVILILGIVFLFIVFKGTSILYVKIKKSYTEHRNLIGKNDHLKTNKILSNIDKFDNIACTDLLICQEYISKYKVTKQQHLKEFYYFEIIHNLYKASEIFNTIYQHKTVYIGDSVEKEYRQISIYRIKNYIKFSKYIYSFLDNCNDIIKDSELDDTLTNLKSIIYEWKL